VKIVSHCWIEKDASLDPGKTAPYMQLQVVTDSGEIYKLVQREEGPRIWLRVMFPALPKRPRRRKT
jgi:hypothetical protein